MKVALWLLGICSLAGMGFTAASFRSEQGDDELTKIASITEGLIRITDAPFKMDDLSAEMCNVPPHNLHQEAYCHVFVDKSGLAMMQSGTGTYPPGALIVKQKFLDAKATTPVLYTLMKKMHDGYDPSHGNWEYSILDGVGQKELARGRIDSCIDCHSAYSETDFVTRAYLPTTQ